MANPKNSKHHSDPDKLTRPATLRIMQPPTPGLETR
jgi:hypothetical protein